MWISFHLLIREVVSNVHATVVFELTLLVKVSEVTSLLKIIFDGSPISMLTGKIITRNFWKPEKMSRTKDSSLRD